MNIKPKMIQKCLWPACLMDLFITGILSLDCDLLNVHLSRVTWQNLRVLRSMSNSFPLKCLRETEAFELPQEILSNTQPVRRDIKEVFYEMSTQAFNIFSQYTFNSTWEEKHLKQIQIGLDRQIEYVEQCLEDEEKENEDMKQMEEDEMKYSRAKVPQLSNLELRRYFNRINKFLKDKKHSHCAWEIVLVEIRRCFCYFQKFTALL
ncbi:interferon kappa [Dasypus novemcinctus]|uniref:Interferon 1FA n=1 Tax=Dasypus novemcinctus TaxID=9361 RepID=A0A7R8C3V5_DASNO|nr:interferon kappa [Dasypus novemcinctus]CAB0000529.1 TPA: interferon 1FA [Dasypus novemcinctus]